MAGNGRKDAPRNRGAGAVCWLVVIVVMLVLLGATAGGVYAYATPAGYNENDYQKLVKFLELTDSAGQKNGHIINGNYNPEDPTTWTGVTWSDGAEKRVTEISWTYKYLTGSLDLNLCTSLTYLVCYYNQLTSLNLSGCENLQTLWCSSNQLTSLDLSNCSALEELRCETNQLTSLDLSGCSNLQLLNCNSNQLTSLNLSDCKILWDLHCSSNRLLSLDLSGCSVLWTLDCSANQLTSLDLSDCSRLNYLNCSSNQLTFADLSPTFNQLSTFIYSPQNPVAIGAGGKIFVGEEIDLSAEARVGHVATDFKWYKNDGEEWVQITPTNSEGGVFTFDESFTGGIIYCKMTNSIFPDLELVTNNVIVLSAVDISSHPQDIMVGAGATATFTVEARSQNSGVLSYQWQLSTDNGKTWNDLPNATKSSYTTGTVAFDHHGRQYRCKITNTKDGRSLEEVYSNSAVLSVVASPSITTHPKNTTVKIGATAGFFITAEVAGGDGVLRYQWQSFDGKAWQDLSGATDPQFTISNVSYKINGAQFRCKVINTKDGVNASIYSNPATLYVVANPSIIGHPWNTTVIVDAAATFTVAAKAADTDEGGNLSYQWQLSTNGGSAWSDIKDATESSYTIPAVALADNGHQYRCKVTNTKNGVSSDPVYSNAATLTVQTHRITFIKPTAANDISNPVNINSGSLVLAKIDGDTNTVAGVTIKVDDNPEQLVTPSGNTIYYLLPASLSNGDHTITITLTNTAGQKIEEKVTFHWDSYRRGFGFGRFDFGEAPAGN